MVVGCLLLPGAVALASVESFEEPQRRRPVPRPFPRPSETTAEPPADPAPVTAPEPNEPPPATPSSAAASAGTTASPRPTDAPTEEMLGVPLYPTAQFITSYDAGRGQRYYLFGTNSAFEEMVRYYRVVLDERGNRVFDTPATHIFEVGRFREREMAFPPSVTIKDYTWNGSDGYLNPSGGEPERFRTIIQVVPVPADQSRR